MGQLKHSSAKRRKIDSADDNLGDLYKRHQGDVVWVDGNKTAFLGLSLVLFGHLQQEPEVWVELLPFRKGAFFLGIDDLWLRRFVQRLYHEHGSPSQTDYTTSDQFLQQRFRLLQIFRIKPLREPAVDL